MHTLTTDRLYLIASNLPLLDAVADQDWAALSTLLGGVDIAENWSHFPEAQVWMRDYLREHPEETAWWNFLIVHRTDACLVGSCGYKGMPTPDGLVEIGYEIADRYQGQGLATETARALVDEAFRHEAVQTIMAHTLAEENASVAVLRKLGFQFIAEIIDLDDGKIWQWQLQRG